MSKYIGTLANLRQVLINAMKAGRPDVARMVYRQAQQIQRQMRDEAMAGQTAPAQGRATYNPTTPIPANDRGFTQGPVNQVNPTNLAYGGGPSYTMPANATDSRYKQAYDPRKAKPMKEGGAVKPKQAAKAVMPMNKENMPKKMSKPSKGVHEMDGHLMKDSEMKEKMAKKDMPPKDMKKKMGEKMPPKNMKEGGGVHDKVHKVMSEYKEGALHSGSKQGPKVTSRKQAVAIGMSEQRKANKKKAK